jgi:hypothetical protein
MRLGRSLKIGQHHLLLRVEKTAHELLVLDQDGINV